MYLLRMILVFTICVCACTNETPAARNPPTQKTSTRSIFDLIGDPNACQGARRIKGIWYEGTFDEQTVKVYDSKLFGTISIWFKDSKGELMAIKKNETWIAEYFSKEYPTDSCPITVTNELKEKFDTVVRTIFNKEHETTRTYTQQTTAD